ncbi:hypothetical protein ERS044109_00532 [Streptococcus pneumoniae]|nr:hypothetical protein ERS044109_00532 [Streptococcus pneumoniae]
MKGQEAPVEENNQVQAAAESETTGVESNSAQPETNPASQEAPQAEGEGKQDQSTHVSNQTSSTSLLQPRTLKNKQSDYDSIPLGDDEDDEDDVRNGLFSSENPVTTIQPRSPRSVTSRSVPPKTTGSSPYNDKYRYYFERGQDPENSQLPRYTYAFFNEKVIFGLEEATKVSHIKDYLKEEIKPTTDGFSWKVTVNQARQNLNGISFLFSVPNGQSLVPNSVTVTQVDDAGTTVKSSDPRDRNDDHITASLKATNANAVMKGTPTRTNASGGDGFVGSTGHYDVSSIDRIWNEANLPDKDSFHSRGQGNNNNARTGLQNDEERKLGDSKKMIINSSGGTVYSGKIAGNTSYTITFKTRGSNDLDKLAYFSAVKGSNGGKTYLAMLLHARTQGERDFADKIRFRLKGNGYYQVEQNTAYYTSTVLNSTGQEIKKDGANTAYSYSKYKDKPLDNGVKGVLTGNDTNDTDKAFDLDEYSYSEYVDDQGQVLNKDDLSAQLEEQQQTITWYKGGQQISKSDLTKDAISSSGVHTYRYRVSYKDNSFNEGEIHFVTKPKKPEITTDIETKLGQTLDVTVRNIEPNSEVTLYRKGANNQAGSLIGTVAANNQGNQVTFSGVNLQAGTYYVKQKAAGSWLDRSNRRVEGVYSDPSSDKKVDGLRVGTTGKIIQYDTIDRKPINQQLVRDNPRNAALDHAFIAESPDGIKTVDVQNPDNLPGFTTNEPSNASSPTRKGINVHVPAGNMQGTYRLVFEVVSNSGTRKTFTTIINYPPVAPSFETTSEKLKGKAQETLKTAQPPIIINAKGVSVSNNKVQTGKKWKVFLVRGGFNNNNNIVPKAEGYEIIAEALPRDGDKRAIFTPDKFKVDKLGTQPLRLITALVDEKTGKVDENVVSTLSESSIQATNPITQYQIRPEVQQDPDTLEVTAKVGQGTANKAKVTYFHQGLVPVSEIFTKVGNSWVKDSQNNNNITVSNNSDGTAIIHIPYGLNTKNTPIAASQHEEGQSLWSENNSVIPKGDETAPKVSLGDAVLPTTENDATTPIYKVVQGSAFAPKLKVWDNIGSVKELDITDIPAGITKQKFGTTFQSQDNAKEANKYSGSTFSGNVADTQAVGQYTAQITVKDASNNTATYYLRYEVLPKVEARQAKFPQVKSKALQDGENPETYIQFKNNTQNVSKPSVADVTWERQPSTATEGLDKTGVVKVTYHVTDENGVARDEVKTVTINTPVYHATVNNGGVYTTTVGTNFSASTSATGGYVNSNFKPNVKYYWKSNRENNYPEYGGDTRSQTADYLGKRQDTIRVFYPNSQDVQDYQDKRSEDHVITFISKPRIPSVDAASLAGKANQENQTVIVSNVTPGTTVKLYNGDTEIGSVNVPKGDNESYTTVKNNVTVTVNGTLPLSDNIRAKTIYTPDNVDSGYSTSVSSTTQAPSKPSISQSPEDLVVKAKVGQDGATKVTLTYINANGVAKTVGFTKNHGNWDKDNANADATVSITNETDGLGEIQLQQDTAQAGSEVTVKQKTDTSDYSPSATIKALSRLEDLRNVAQADGAVDIHVPEDATRMSLTYTPTGQATPTTLEYTKNGRTWTAHNGINTYSDERKISIPKGVVEDGTTVSVIASNDSKTTTNVKSKAKFEQPSEITNTIRQNGDVEVTLPTNAEEVTLSYKNKQNVMSTVTVSKSQGNTWTVGNLPDGVSFRDGKVTFDYRKVNRDTPITISATRGTGEEKSQQRTKTISIPEHEVEVTKITKKAGESTTNEELLAAIDVAKKKSAVLKKGTQYPTTVGNYDLEVMVTYADDSTEIVRVPYEVTAVDNTGLTTAKNALDTERNKAVDTTGKTPASVAAYNDAKQKAQEASDAAQTVLNNPNATEQQIQDEITKVNAAKEKLGKAEAGLTTAATAQAKQELTTAKEGLEEPVSTDGMTPDSIKAYEAAKKEAAQAVADAKAAAQAAEAKGENATEAEVNEAKAKVDAAKEKLKAAKDLLVPKSDNTGLTTAKNALDTERNKAVDTTGKTPASVAAYNDAKQKAQEASDAAQTVLNNPNATEQQIQDEITKVNAAKEKLGKAEAGLVDKPTSVPSKDGNSGNTNNSANTNNGGTTTPADSNSNSVTPDNSANTPAPNVTTDDSRNTTSATPSFTVGGQAQASTPAQETPVSPSTPNNSSNTATPSEARPVDKFELARLVEELETRLKNLDGIDQSVIDAAKIILVESQVALRNTDLTEAGLREITAKVKEALESLKGKQATKDEEEMQETSKEQGHLPYGTMIASLLAFLGLLLFLIARRKKESELKKLTKGLTKVLQESDLTSVDSKLLDQAREALAQAVPFLANEKESDHTEDELIEKLKAILAQLR